MLRIMQLILVASCMLTIGSVQAGGNAAAGKAKSEACADCHGDMGKGDADTPKCAGLTPDDFTKAMKEYQNETRTKSKKMIKAAKKLSDEDIADLAAYYANLK